MDNGQSKVNWAKWGTIASLVAAAVGFMVWRDNRERDREARAKEPANIVVPPAKPVPDGGVVPEPENIPSGPNMPTVLSFRNDGKQEALVKQVILSGGVWIKTPLRRKSYGEGKPIKVAFTQDHYDRTKNEYRLKLLKPAAAPGGGQWTTLSVALVEPKRVGETMACTVTIFFDGMEQRKYLGVNLDALKEAPEKTPED